MTKFSTSLLVLQPVKNL